LKTTIIAEVGSNHCGSLRTALESIEAAKWAGADLVKFQAWDTNKFINMQRAPDTYVTFKRYEIPRDWYIDLKDENVFFTPFNVEIVDYLEQYINPRFYKISSGDFTYKPLIDVVIKTGKKFFISNGAATYEETLDTIDYIKSKNKYTDFALLHCVVRYPAPSAMLGDYKLWHDGYSDHTLSLIAPCLAVTRGASVIEKHFKLRDCASPDDGHSLKPDQFKQMVDMIREIDGHMESSERPYPKEVLNKIRRGSDGRRPV